LSTASLRSRIGRAALIAALVALMLAFVGLAVWQVERRAWKHALIARVDQRVHAEPVEAPDAAHFTAADDEYRHVRVSGRFIAGKETFVRATTVLGSGYWLVVPLRRTDGTIVLINRGFVTSADRSRLAVPPDETTITGLLRASEPRGTLIRDNRPDEDRWVSRDVRAIALRRGLHDVAPYFVDADADPATAADGGVPVGGLTVVAFTDNHLLYAVTWSGLALLVAAAVVRVMRGGRSTA
jgi:surfeit locus 1 family protein